MNEGIVFKCGTCSSVKYFTIWIPEEKLEFFLNEEEFRKYNEAKKQGFIIEKDNILCPCCAGQSVPVA